jgi:hypothetical protein
MSYLHINLHPGYIGDHGKEQATNQFFQIAKDAAMRGVLPTSNALEIYQRFHEVLTKGNHAIPLHDTPWVLRQKPALDLPVEQPRSFVPLSLDALNALIPMDTQRMLRGVVETPPPAPPVKKKVREEPPAETKASRTKARKLTAEEEAGAWTISDEGKFVCSHEGCKKQYISITEARRHFREHSDTEQHVCNICVPAKPFAGRSSLQVHHYQRHAPRKCLWKDCAAEVQGMLKAAMDAHLKDHRDGKSPPEPQNAPATEE